MVNSSCDVGDSGDIKREVTGWEGKVGERVFMTAQKSEQWLINRSECGSQIDFDLNNYQMAVQFFSMIS